MTRYARVAVPAPLMPLDTLLDYRIPPELEGSVVPGSLVNLKFARRKSWGLVFDVTDSTVIEEKKLRDLDSLILDQPIFERARLQFLLWLSKHYFFPIGEVCETAIPSSIRKGTTRTLSLAHAALKQNRIASKFELNDRQRTAVEKIGAEPTGTRLLWGVTGSGKTEVYLEAIDRCLTQGKSALVLVPEIALTPQLTNRFQERFPGHVAVFHSAQKPSQTRAGWLACLRAERSIAIGPRSALFVPISNPGIIIVDEEHDGSYKQDDRLKYNARDGAVALGALYKIPVVLGSATPSAESLYDVNRSQSVLCELPARAVKDARPPEIEIVDLKKGFSVENKATLPNEAADPTVAFSNVVRGDFFLSPPLREALSTLREKNEQAILFLNRRGVGSQEFCRTCGTSIECPNCAVKLSPHRSTLLCHYCGYESATPKVCDACKTGDFPFVRVGVGTESIEEAVAAHFPELRLLRMDRDTIKTGDEIQSVVDRFRRHEADVLIGTQMVAKGHDFPSVTLVGILFAELGLGVPDFRAAERNYQLMLQVSGRAGRAFLPGRVILQTFQPENPLFTRLKNADTQGDYRKFLEDEIATRQEMNYPPSSRLALLRFDGLDPASVEDAARMVGRGLRKISAEGFNVLGPVACPIFKIRNRFRWQILLKAKNQNAFHRSVSWLLEIWEREKLEQKYKTRLVIDVDPIQML